jgi:hypothetical protein
MYSSQRRPRPAPCHPHRVRVSHHVSAILYCQRRICHYDHPDQGFAPSTIPPRLRAEHGALSLHAQAKRRDYHHGYQLLNPGAEKLDAHCMSNDLGCRCGLGGHNFIYGMVSLLSGTRVLGLERRKCKVLWLWRQICSALLLYVPGPLYHQHGAGSGDLVLANTVILSAEYPQQDKDGLGWSMVLGCYVSHCWDISAVPKPND